MANSMARHPMVYRVAQVLGHDPDLAFEFYCMASEIVDDFEDYGSALQADEDGEYSDGTTIARLRVARNCLIELIRGPDVGGTT